MTGARAGAAAAAEAHAGNEAADSGPLLAHPAPVAVIASAFAVLALVTAPTAGQGFLAAFMAAVLVILAATDLERRIIPNRIVLPAAAVALVVNIASSPDRSPEFILAALALGVVFLIPNLINQSLMGMGDIKLMVLLGAGLGWSAVAAVMLGFLSVVPVAVLALVRGGLAARNTTLPFGPFLAFGGLVIVIVPHLIG